MREIGKFLNEYTRKILDILSVGIIVTDEDANVQYINPSFEKFSGLKADSVIGKHWASVREGARLPEALIKKKQFLNIPRKVGDLESVVDLIPIMEEGTLIGGIVIQKDVKTILSLAESLKKNTQLLKELNQRVRGAFKAYYSFEDIIGNENSDYLVMARKAAKTDSPVFLVGESGTGKELIAQAIHNESDRKEFPFVDINCAALPESLLESELFGYSPGAFTDANKTGKIGLFELANGGTLFLDEVTEMPLNMQGKLLRVLQEKNIRRIGDNKNIPIDVRVIAATNKNVNDLIDEGKFRSDLYFRLAVFVINIPPLRERSEDIPLLIKHFIEEQEIKHKRYFTISNDSITVLQNYSWPGNIRELKNSIEYACNVTEDYIIDTEDLPQNIYKINNLNYYISKTFKEKNLKSIIEEIEKEVLHNYLKRFGNSLEAKKVIAEELGISIATLYNKLKKYNM